jgi:hypothetical protein
MDTQSRPVGRVLLGGSAALILLVAACNTQPAGSVQPSAAASVGAVPGDGLTGQVTVKGGPHDGDYQLAAEPSTVVCVAGPDQWTVGFASPVLTGSITTLQLAGSSRDAEAPLADFFMTIGATTEPNTMRISPSQYGGQGTTVFRLEGNVAHVEMTGTSADGAAVSMQLTCAPVDARP